MGSDFDWLCVRNDVAFICGALIGGNVIWVGVGKSLEGIGAKNWIFKENSTNDGGKVIQ